MNGRWHGQPIKDCSRPNFTCDEVPESEDSAGTEMARVLLRLAAPELRSASASQFNPDALMRDPLQGGRSQWMCLLARCVGSAFFFSPWALWAVRSPVCRISGCQPR